MSINVRELRLALLWTKRFAGDTLMPMADSSQYKTEFSRAKAGAGDWVLPWLPGDRQHFWQYYLYVSEIGDLEGVDGQRAWNYLMPLRAPAQAQIEAPEGVRITLEGFCYPHSVGVLATAFLSAQQDKPLFDMVDQAVSARHAHYGVIWKEDGSATHGALDSLADLLIDRMHTKVLGQAPHGNPVKDPLTVATMIDATIDRVKGKEALSQQQHEIGRALFGLAKLDPDWQQASLNLPELQRGGSPSEDWIYMRERGRAVWLPKHFSSYIDPPLPRTRALGCYHRNLALATLQARSLTNLVRRADDFLPAGPIPIVLTGPTKRAIQILGGLYRGDADTYQTGPLRFQIEFYAELLNRVGDAVGEFWA